MCPFKELTFYLYVIHNSRRRTAATWRNELLLQLINVTVKGLTLILLPPGGLKNINSLLPKYDPSLHFVHLHE